MRILMIVWTDVASDTRVRRAAASLAEAGHSVQIIGRDVPEDVALPDRVTVLTGCSGVGLRGQRTARVAWRRLAVHERAARWLLLPSHVNLALRAWQKEAYGLARGLAFDVVHAHDFSALPVGARLAAEHRAPLIYDAHEYWPGRPRTGRPTPLKRMWEKAQERRLGAQASAVVTVGDGIAELLRRTYGWERIVVVRNSFPAPRAPYSGPSLGQPTGLVYAGRIAAHREIETIVAAAPALKPLDVMVIGPADQTYLRGLAIGEVQVLPMMPVDAVTDRLREAGLALVTHSSRWTNHRIALPNKLFHAVHAGVPVVASDVGELAKIVRQYKIGTLYQPGNAASLVQAVQAASEAYSSLLDHVQQAASELSWERDRKTLINTYREIEIRARAEAF